MIETRTIRALGFDWKISDGRMFSERGAYKRRIAVLRPHDIETGQELTTFKIGQCTRDAGFIEASIYKHHTGKAAISFSSRFEEFTPAANKKLKEALEPFLDDFRRPLSREECMAHVLGSIENSGAMYLRHGMKDITGYFELRKDVDSGSEQDLSILSLEERQAIASAWAAAFAEAILKEFPGVTL